MIRSKEVRGKKYLVVIDIIRGCNPSSKPSKVWSEWKKRNQEYPFVIFPSHKFTSSNGRIYELECVKESDKAKVEETFRPRNRGTVSKPVVVSIAKLKHNAGVATKKVIGKVLTIAQTDSIFSSLKKCHDDIAKILK